MFDGFDEEFEDDELLPRRRPRIYRERQEYLNAMDFRQRFRLMPWQAELLLRTIGGHIQSNSRVRTAMTALRFYATNGFYYFDGDAQGLFCQTKTRYPNVLPVGRLGVFSIFTL